MKTLWRALFASMAALAVLSGCASTESMVFSGLNCRLAAPPANSGEDAAHQTLMKVYPRISDMESAYSGCQSVWVEDGESWVLMMVGRFENGKVTGVWHAGVPGREPPGSCEVKSGPVANKSNHTCAELDAFPFPSVPALCFTKIKAEKRDRDCPYDEARDQ